MSQAQTVAVLLDRLNGMLQKHLADFTDADMLVRPVENANHAAWQLTHVLKTNTATANAIAPGANITFPAKYAEASTKPAAAWDDPDKFPRKDELLQMYDHLLTTLRTAVSGMSEEQFDQPSPEAFAKFAPTLGQLAMMVPLHTGMHVGQIQVIRRKLKKPVLF